jgi:hypothetical protein
MFTPGQHYKEFGDTNEVIRIQSNHNVKHHLVEIISICCVHHRHIVLLFVEIFNKILTFITINREFGDINEVIRIRKSKKNRHIK